MKRHEMRLLRPGDWITFGPISPADGDERVIARCDNGHRKLGRGPSQEEAEAVALLKLYRAYFRVCDECKRLDLFLGFWFDSHAMPQDCSIPDPPDFQE